MSFVEGWLLSIADPGWRATAIWILSKCTWENLAWFVGTCGTLYGAYQKFQSSPKSMQRRLDRQILIARQHGADRRNEVKEVVSSALAKARGLPARNNSVGLFKKGDALVEAARYVAQKQPADAIKVLNDEAPNAQNSVKYAESTLAAARERAATLYLELGQIYEAQTQYQDAIDAYREMLRFNPADMDALRLLGNLHRSSGKYEDAIEHFGQLLVAFPLTVSETEKKSLQVEVAIEICATRRLAGSSGDNALADIEAAVALAKEINDQPKLAMAHLEAGRMRSVRKHWKQANAAYDEATTTFNAIRDERGKRVAEAEKSESERKRALVTNGKSSTDPAATPAHLLLN